MPHFMTQVAEFFSERARGLLLTITGTGIGKVSGVIENIVPQGPTVLETVQMWSYIGAIAVALLTCISYMYKFYLFIKDRCKKSKSK